MPRSATSAHADHRLTRRPVIAERPVLIPANGGHRRRRARGTSARRASAAHRRRCRAPRAGGQDLPRGQRLAQRRQRGAEALDAALEVGERPVALDPRRATAGRGARRALVAIAFVPDEDQRLRRVRARRATSASGQRAVEEVVVEDHEAADPPRRAPRRGSPPRRRRGRSARRRACSGSCRRGSGGRPRRPGTRGGTRKPSCRIPRPSASAAEREQILVRHLRRRDDRRSGPAGSAERRASGRPRRRPRARRAAGARVAARAAP